MSSSTQSPFDRVTDLTGRIALVTGGGTGIGLMIAKMLASRGAIVYATGRRADILEKAAALAIAGNGKILSLPMNVTSKPSIQNAVKVIASKHGRLNILVNNAGSGGPVDATTHSAQDQKDAQEYGDSLFKNQSFESWSDLLSLNVSGVFFVTTAFLGLLEASTKDIPGSTASVINITSVIAHLKLAYARFCYSASKSSISHLTKVMASDFALKGLNIRVNAIAPGRFLSEFLLSLPKEKQDESAKGPWLALNPCPLKRMGTDEEMGATAVYLASDASAYMNGQILLIDGGLSLVNPSVS